MSRLPAAWLTTRYLRDMRGTNGEVETLITTVLGVALIITSLTLLFRSRLKGWRAEHGNGARLRAGVTVLTGAVLGTLVAFTSIGAGALGAAALSLLYPRLPSIRIIGTDIAHAVPMAALAGWGHWQMGTVDLGLLVSLLLGSLPGVYLGTRLGVSLPERGVRTALAGMLMLIGLRFVL